MAPLIFNPQRIYLTMKTLNHLEEKAEETSNENPISQEKVLNKKKKVKKAPVGKKAVDMEEMLRNSEFNVPKIGDLIKGNIVAVSNSAIYVDLGVLGTGIIMGREMKDGLGIVENLKEGDEIEATVVELEDDDGYVELSIREAAYEKAWKELKRKMEEKETVSTRILEANRGGLMVEVNGIYGFLPVSQLSHEHYPRVEDGDKNKILQILLKLVGKEIKVKVIDVDVEEEKLIVSEKATYEEKEKAVIGEFSVLDTVEGVVSGVVNFGAFVKFSPKGKSLEETSEEDLLEGLVHISELAWQLIEDPHEIIKTGERVRCKIIDIDGTRVSLSIRALIADPWTQIKDKYEVDKIIPGMVTKINPFGAFVQLDKDIHGLAHVSEIMGRFKVRSLNEVLEVGKKYNFKILSIEPESHRLGLSLLTKKEEEEFNKVQEDGKEKKKTESHKKGTKSSKGAKKSKSKGKDVKAEDSSTVDPPEESSKQKTPAKKSKVKK